MDWDLKLDEDILKLWKTFCVNFENVSSMRFQRRTFYTDKPIKLFIFADASKEAFGCAFYVLQDAQRHLIFSKVKVSPLKERTLPTLELLASQLALKCFLTLSSSGIFKDVVIDEINLCG